MLKFWEVKKMKINLLVKLILFSSVILFVGFVLENSKTVKLSKANPEFQQKEKPGKLEDKGIGPIKELKLGNIDQKLVDKGSDIFYDKCSLCHNIDDVNLAPPLRGISKYLPPEFIMNYLMNTTEMQKKDPYVKKLIQEWKKVPIMKDQHLKKKDARAVLEFLRSLDEK